MEVVLAMVAKVSHVASMWTINYVFEHFQNSFDLEDLTNGAFELFMVCSYVMVRNIFKSITRMLRATWLLPFDKTFQRSSTHCGEQGFTLVNE